MNFIEKSKYEYVIEKSRFIGFVYEINSTDQVKEILSCLKKEHKKAKHICYAYYLNDGISIKMKSWDDGEPQGTASKPMINIVQNFCIENNKNICIFIIRYFGGIKLGASGLYRSYSKVTSESIKNYK